MKLFVSNCTGQNRVVYIRLDYAVDENGRRVNEKTPPPRMRELGAREQVMFGEFIHPSQMQETIEQLEAMGAVHVDAVRTAKMTGQVKMVWSQDKPIPYPLLKDVVEHNMEYLSEEGTLRRQRLAVASDALLTRDIAAIPEVGEPRMFEAEFESDEEEDPDTPGLVAQGVTIPHTRRAPDKPKPKTRGRKTA